MTVHILYPFLYWSSWLFLSDLKVYLMYCVYQSLEVFCSKSVTYLFFLCCPFLMWSIIFSFIICALQICKIFCFLIKSQRYFLTFPSISLQFCLIHLVLIFFWIFFGNVRLGIQFYVLSQFFILHLTYSLSFPTGLLCYLCHKYVYIHRHDYNMELYSSAPLIGFFKYSYEAPVHSLLG